MSYARFVNVVVTSTQAVLDPDGTHNLRPGHAFARDAPLTPYEYTGIGWIQVGTWSPLALVLSMPSGVVDSLADQKAQPDEDRVDQVARWLQAIVDTGSGQKGLPPATLDRPRMIVGPDVVVPSLTETGPRICMPFLFDTGGLVVELSRAASPSDAE